MTRVTHFARALAGALLGLASATPAARSQSANGEIAVTVVEVAGGLAYLEPGETAGVRRGDRVAIGRRSYQVDATSASYAVVELNGRRLAAGARGTVRIRHEAETGTARLPPPRPLSAFAGQWPRTRLPADAQHPEPVPLGPVVAGDATWVALSAGGAGIVPLGGDAEPIASGELRARMHYEPFRELPVRFDADVAAQLWIASDLDARAGRDSRPWLRVRQLEAAYGRDDGALAALGRLRYAARTLGLLDGAKLQAELSSGFSLGAFGGFVPDPLDGAPATDAARFGAELGWQEPSLLLQPRAGIVASGSHFDGNLDERRLNAFVDLFPGAHRLSAYAELAIHGDDNPWSAPAQELSAAGADLAFRFGEVDIGARFDMQRPERSRWLAAFLPPSWLCVASAGTAPAASAVQPCFGDEVRYLASADAGVRLGRIVLGAGGTLSTSSRGDTDQRGGFVSASVLRIFDVLRVDTSAMASTGSLLTTLAFSAGAGLPLADGLLDVALRYRPAWTRYRADTKRFLEHTAGLRIAVTPAGELSFTLDADAITGRDLDALLIQTLLVFRPLGG